MPNTESGSSVDRTIAIEEGRSVAEFDVRQPLDRLFEKGRATLPHLDLDASRFAEWVAERSDDGAMLAEEMAADLYLACACVESVPGAIETFESHVLAGVRGTLARVNGEADFVDEVMQAMRDKLFVPRDGREPRIAEYAGRAPLRRWAAAVAIRLGLNLRRGKAAHERRLRIDDAVMGSPPDLLYIKERYRHEFEAALQAGFAALTARERTLLQLHYREKLGVDRLGAMYRVGRSTAHRWISRARDALLEASRAALMARLGLTDSEFDSIAALVVSDLDISLLGKGAGGPAEE